MAHRTRIVQLGLLALVGAGVTLVAVRVRHAPEPRDAWVRPAAPIVTWERRGTVRFIETRQAAEQLLPDTAAPREPVRLLSLAGRVTEPAGRRSLVIDAEGRLLGIDERLRVRVQPLPIDGSGPWQDVAATPSGGLWLTDAQGALYLVSPSGPSSRLEPATFRAPALAEGATDAKAWVTRSTAQLAGGFDSLPGPLLWEVDSAGDARRSLGRAIRPAHVLLEDLANAGHAVVGDSLVYFAPFIRDELVAMRRTGETLWVTSRGLPHSTRQPRFEVRDRRVAIDYHPVNLGLTMGPDGLLYLLSVDDANMTRSRVDVVDPVAGALVRTALLGEVLPTLAVSASGRMYRLDAQRLLGKLDPAARRAAPALALDVLGGGRASSDSLRGRVQLVNVWASWCTPCRTEMPALDSLRQRLMSRPAFAFVSINEDSDPSAARRFLAEGDHDFPVLLGGAGFHRRYGAAGLPLTLLVDGEGREVRRWLGFDGPRQIAEIERAIDGELSRQGRHSDHASRHPAPPSTHARSH